MDYGNRSDMELLSLLVGARTAQKLLNGGLASLLVGKADALDLHPKIEAARELVMRALKEELRRGSALTSPAAVRDYLRLLLSGKEHEVFVVVFLDAQNRVIETEELFRGTLTQTSVYPREVVKRALAQNAAAVILAHNHPSGVAEPSVQDQALTRTLTEALGLVDFKVLDHFIVAPGEIGRAHV